MSNPYEKTSLFEQLQAGLEDSVAFSKGQLSLKTTGLPAPPPKASGQTVINLRMQLKMTQAVFAATLNVSPKTVQSWEQGTRAPSHAALRILEVIRRNPAVVSVIFDDTETQNASRNTGTRTRISISGKSRGRIRRIARMTKKVR